MRPLGHWRSCIVTLSEDKSTNTAASRVPRNQNGPCVLWAFRRWSAPLKNRLLPVAAALPGPGRRKRVQNRTADLRVPVLSLASWPRQPAKWIHEAESAAANSRRSGTNRRELDDRRQNRSPVES